MYWKCKERVRRVGVGGKSLGAEEEMNMRVWVRNGVGGRYVREDRGWEMN